MSGSAEEVRTFADPALAGGLGMPRDPDLDGLEEELDGDHLDALGALAELAAPVVMEDTVIPHRFRKGWAVRYATVLDADDLKRWRKRALIRKGRTEEVDDIRLACIVLANLCREILRNGSPVLAPDDADDLKPLTFAHPAMWRLYGADRAATAVRKFYGNDPYLVATLEAVLAEAGVGEEVEPLDPTQRSAD